MKLFKLLVLITLLASCGGPTKDGNTHVKGTVNGGTNEMLYVDLLTATKPITIDSFTLENGSFETEFDVDASSFYRIRQNDKNFVICVINPGDNIVIATDLDNLEGTALFQGSAETTRLRTYNARLAAFYASRDSLTNVMKMHQAQKLVPELEKDYASGDRIIGNMLAFTRQFIKVDPGSYASLSAVRNLNIDDDLPLFAEILEGLEAKHPESEYLVAFKAQITQARNMMIGADAPEISMMNPGGHELKLSDLRGKVVLIDFWASWCGPCRRENPNVVATYQAFKDKGFEIFSVSLDEDKAKWLAAIQQDNLLWPNHVTDFGGWKSAVVPVYGIQGIPFTVLLDQEGKIIAKNLRGEQLAAKLKEVLG